MASVGEKKKPGHNQQNRGADDPPDLRRASRHKPDVCAREIHVGLTPRRAPFDSAPALDAA
jgi:hypothetical protein